MALTGIYGAVDPVVAKATVHTALDLGVRLFDTAALYGDGENEHLLGRTLGNRPDAFIVTKFGLATGRGGTLVRDSDPASMRTSVDASLRRLRRERIDLLLQHRPDPNTQDAVVAEVAADLIRQGKIAAFGLSASTSDRTATFDRMLPLAAVQNELSLAEPADRAEAQALDRRGTMFMAYAPLGRGLLTGKLGLGMCPDDLRAGMPRFRNDGAGGDDVRFEAVCAVAEEHGASPAAAALAWVLRIAPNVVPIPGARDPRQLGAAVRAADLALDAGDLLRMEGRPAGSVP